MRNWFGLAIMLWAASALGGGNLLENGDFENKKDPLAGWMVDYRWTENSNYMENYTRVAVVPSDGMKRNVLKISAPPESKVESQLIPFDPKARYRCTMDVKAQRGLPTRIYFAGYRWKSGVRPHEKPHPGELRPVYKSKAISKLSSSWQTVSLEFPMKKLSATARKHLKYVRFISLYVWTAQGVSIDNVKLIKTK